MNFAPCTSIVNKINFEQHMCLCLKPLFFLMVGCNNPSQEVRDPLPATIFGVLKKQIVP